MDTVAKMKQKTAYRAVDFGKSGRVVGFENGSTCARIF
jgi:ribose 5-phosphate isomerase